MSDLLYCLLWIISGRETYNNLRKSQWNLNVCAYCIISITPWNFTQTPTKCILFTMSEEEITTKQFESYIHSNLLWLKRKGKKKIFHAVVFFSMLVKQNKIILVTWEQLSAGIQVLFSAEE